MNIIISVSQDNAVLSKCLILTVGVGWFTS